MQVDQGISLTRGHTANVESIQEIAETYKSLTIDFNAVKLFYKTLSSSVSQAQMFEMMDLMRTMIYEIAMERADDQEAQLMCIRGLLILISNEQITEYQA